jgi:hypothetical protein
MGPFINRARRAPRAPSVPFFLKLGLKEAARTMTRVCTPPDAPPNHRSLEGIADPSDLMRQLSDLFVLAPGCRRTGCRMAERCQGGDGPPCFHEHPELFAQAMSAGLRETRQFWKRQRALAGEAAAHQSRAIPPREGSAETGASAPARVGRKHGACC